MVTFNQHFSFTVIILLFLVLCHVVMVVHEAA